MRAMALAILTLPAVLALAPPAEAQPALTRCRAIQEDARRLVCFDQAAAALRFEEIMGPPMACRGELRPANLMRALKAEGFIAAQPYMAPDSLNYFEVRQPLTIGNLPVVAVYAFDEMAPQGEFRRGPGTSPGNVLGFVTTGSLYAVDEWRRRTNPRLRVDDYENYGRGGPDAPRAKQVHCSYWGPG